MKAQERNCRNLVAQRSNNNCERCGQQAHTYHHRLKQGQGGPWTPSNILHLCGHGTIGCHHWCESRVNDAHAVGFHVRPWEVPGEVPVLRWGVWLLLDDEGGISPVDLNPETSGNFLA